MIKILSITFLLGLTLSLRAQLPTLEINSVASSLAHDNNSDPLGPFKNKLYRDFFRNRHNEANFIPTRSFSINVKLRDNRVDTVILSQNTNLVTQQFVAENFRKADYEDLLYQVNENGWRNANIIIPIIEIYHQTEQAGNFETLVEKTKSLSKAFSFAQSEYWIEKSVVLAPTVIVYSKPVR